MSNHGTVKWFNDKKGFGFIVPDHGGPDVFVHVTDLKPGQTLTENQQVHYEIGKDKGGRPVAKNVVAG